ncbi:uncharacterized protein ACLA_016850 [Aspergillus clavatus NRRL 1]|uniref:Uncharacterized protein n=1 Tax=Aspergillus clavatus (strain ATCC 1007 / CBS 513.65 / DSM 816 / NCTC 3887 / NRRL 1 / QM 1276 / 107) TaxID=344612 RepID=A1CBX1_ASPCL|nr:uncharacterized protein ACLA_016850 [Aspergillus clavatus NRRL 1]EAW13239.1 hypothetical protein ACLA_016850 [Aspergillus clavatus NRRL 1]
MIFGLVFFVLRSDKRHSLPNLSHRLALMKWFAPMTPHGWFIYGWGRVLQDSLDRQDHRYVHHWRRLTGREPCPRRYIWVDVFGAEAAASALAANLVVQSLFGGFVTPDSCDSIVVCTSYTRVGQSCPWACLFDVYSGTLAFCQYGGVPKDSICYPALGEVPGHRL